MIPYAVPSGFILAEHRECGCAVSYRDTGDFLEIHSRVCASHRRSATDQASVDHLLSDLSDRDLGGSENVP